MSNFILLLLVTWGLPLTVNSFSFALQQSIPVIHTASYRHGEMFHKRRYDLYSTSLSLASTSDRLDSDQQQEQKISCQFCTETFDSRNALFRHLRNSETCAMKANGGKEISPFCLQKNNVVLNIAYDTYMVEYDDASITRTESDAMIVGEFMRNVFLKSIHDVFKDEIEVSIKMDDELIPEIISSTQTSVANQRYHSLSQENGVGSIDEVMTISYSYPVRKTLKGEKKGYQEQERIKSLEQIADKISENLSSVDMTEFQSRLQRTALSDVQLLSIENVPDNSNLHAEMSCTQRAYHYILPLRWLEGGKEVEEWWLNNRAQMIQSMSDNNELFGFNGEIKAKTPPPNDVLKKLKAALRSAECKRTSEKGAENVAAGRFGVLSLKQKRPFHNFSCDQLKGDASPNNKPVWRILDRCRIVQFIPYETEDDKEVMAVIEFRGDDFVKDQVRRIVGAAVAITNDWLPSEFMDKALQSDMFIETPLAPVNHMYFADARFHFDELVQGKRFFEDENNSGDNKAVITSFLQKKILARIRDTQTQKNDEHWLEELQNVIAPRIYSQIDDSISVNPSLVIASSEAPGVYKETLSILRAINSDGRWPSTSIARSRVIKQSKDDQNENDGVVSSGSFTIINPKYQNGSLLNNDNVRVPLGNDLFPDLVEAVFSLELQLAQEKDGQIFGRPESSHCAVNRNAQFTPHVDSGRGKGQSLSMIVGLGDYSGGELMIEGDPYHIRYEPKEFDGWKSRHWTAPFNGERFSLVWFTPDI